MRDQLNQAYKKRLFIILSLFFISMTIALTVAQSTKQQNIRSSAAGELTNCAIDSVYLLIDTEENSLLQKINTYRVSHGLHQLASQEDINRAAAWNSQNMAQRNLLDHTDSFGRTPDIRIKNCGYDPLKFFAENVAKDQTRADDVMNGWINSEGHKPNILCTKCTHIGIGRHQISPNSPWFWTMTVGSQEGSRQSPAPSPSVSQSITTPTVDPRQPTTPEVTLPPAKTTLPEGTTGVFATIYIPGIDEFGNPHPLHPNRPLTITVLGPDNKEIAKADGVVSYNPDEEVFYGAVELPTSLETGTYIIKVKTDRSITRTVFSGFLTIEKGKGITLPEVTLPGVDLDENNAITIADVYFFRNCLKTQKCDQADTDLNDDGEANILDYAVFLEVFGFYEGE